MYPSSDPSLSSLPRPPAVLEVGRLVAEHLEAHRPVAHAVLPQELHGVVQDSARGLVVVKEVPSLKDEVHLVLLGQLEDLLERVDGVLAAFGVLLCVANVVVSGCMRTNTRAVIPLKGGVRIMSTRREHLTPGSGEYAEHTSLQQLRDSLNIMLNTSSAS